MPHSDFHEVRDNPRDQRFRKTQFLFVLVVSVFQRDVQTGLRNENTCSVINQTVSSTFTGKEIAIAVTNVIKKRSFDHKKLNKNRGYLVANSLYFNENG